MSDLFSGIPVSEFATALPWYEKLFGFPPAFHPHDTEAVWRLAEHQYVYIVQSSEHAGHAIVMHMVDDLESRITAISDRGLELDREEHFPNDICKVTYSDADGNEMAFGGIRPKAQTDA